MKYIFKTMDSAIDSGTCIVVVDMSWARITNDMKRVFYRQVQKIFKILPRK